MAVALTSLSGTRVVRSQLIRWSIWITPRAVSATRVDSSRSPGLQWALPYLSVCWVVVHKMKSRSYGLGTRAS
ncbi:hypothetical protein BJY01DRAFT_202366 [Aspergillus pseudoustus]|uniref:Secreted protein n=1 Tax=Aspergillus pseudoustus TaxID=1810923 RepID=A0ABR4KZZ8_9EURO